MNDFNLIPDVSRTIAEAKDHLRSNNQLHGWKTPAYLEAVTYIATNMDVSADELHELHNLREKLSKLPSAVGQEGFLGGTARGL